VRDQNFRPTGGQPVKQQTSRELRHLCIVYGLVDEVGGGDDGDALLWLGAGLGVAEEVADGDGTGVADDFAGLADGLLDGFVDGLLELDVVGFGDGEV
jgi:hypothetical protein